MRHYYSVDAIRQAEATMLASLPDGALMRRAAQAPASTTPSGTPWWYASKAYAGVMPSYRSKWTGWRAA